MFARDSNNNHDVNQNEGHASVCMFRRRNNRTDVFGEVWYWKSTLEVVRIKFWPALVFLNVKLNRTYRLSQRRITEQQDFWFFFHFLLQQVITKVQENKEGLNQVLIGQDHAPAALDTTVVLSSVRRHGNGAGIAATETNAHGLMEVVSGRAPFKLRLFLRLTRQQCAPFVRLLAVVKSVHYFHSLFQYEKLCRRKVLINELINIR
jgi:hypothetical protein